MQFLFLVFINIIIAVIFYLILRLRLEKYATDYREKRLKKEMDQIISEFNETAERNISILENRIETIKKLMEKTGIKDSIDIRIEEEPVKEFKKQKIIEQKPDKLETADNKNFISKLRKKINTASDNLFSISNETQATGTNETDIGEGGQDGIYEQKMEYDEKIEGIEIRFQNEELERLIKQNDAEKESPKVELSEMFKNADDKYKLISVLYNEGYSAEFISECSSIPIGEIKLVLDLNAQA